MRGCCFDLGKQALAALVLIIAAYILFKIVIGFVAGILWILLVIVAMVAIVWARPSFGEPGRGVPRHPVLLRASPQA